MLRLVAYDLHKPEKDYEELFKALKSYDWAHPQRSVWFLKTSKNVPEIMKHLKSHIDSNDSLIVTEVNDWSVLGVGKEVIDWLRR